MTSIHTTTQTDSRADLDARTPRGRIALAHGGGGQLTDELLDDLILPRLGNNLLGGLLDSALLAATGTDRLAMTIDSYVVQPWRFPGGDIGRLAVCGTVNDLAVCGGDPLGIALGLIIAEGFEKSDLAQVIDSIAQAGDEAGVSVVTGDTKVVGRDQADGIYITTAGVARVPRNRVIKPERVQPGDVIIVNGPVGEHGLAVMLARELPQVTSVLRTDAAPLNGLITNLLAHVPDVLFMRDATRAGLAGVTCDLARDCGYRVTLDEARIPIRPEAQHAADMLGLDPLEVANEGKVVAVVRPYEADAAVKAMRQHPLGQHAQIIGHVGHASDGLCELRTLIGGRRIIQKPYGEQLPRIC